MNVVVVGAGPAGARTAQLLAAGGCRVAVLEARDRVGGRLHTREADGARWEAGGEWIDADHHRVLASLAELGLAPHAESDRRRSIVFDGETAESADGGTPPSWADAGLDAEAVDDARDRLLLDLDPPAWSNVLYPDLDETTLGAWLDRLCRTRRGRWWQEANLRSDEGDGTHRVGLLGWLAGQMDYDGRAGGEMSAFRFPDGAQAWVARMLAVSGAEVVLDAPVQAVRRGVRSLEVVTPARTFAADRVVLAVPPPALSRIAFEPELSEPKQSALEDARMGRTVKVALRFDRPVWADAGATGQVLTDARSQQWWPSPDGRTLLAYVVGDDAEALRAEPDPAAAVLADVAGVWPAARSAYRSGELHDWVADPWAGGGFPHIPPGFALGGWEDLLRPEGGLHFAGDAFTPRNGFIEGALESAERVAAEILSPP